MPRAKAKPKAVIPPPPPGEPDRFIVEGFVNDARGSSVRGAAVTAWDQDLRTRQQLGQAVTDVRGRYEIGYTTQQFSAAEFSSADVVVTVAGAAGEVLAESDVVFNAPSRVRIDVTIPNRGAESEFDFTVRTVTPLLEGQNVKLESLQENDSVSDITFLTNDTGIERQQLLDLAVAQRMPGLTKIDPQFWYATLRQQVFPERVQGGEPASIDDIARIVAGAIPNTPAATVEAALNRAIDRNLIAAGYKDRIAAWMKQYGDLLSSGANAGALPHLIDVAGVDRKRHDVFAQAVLAGGNRAAILERIKATKQFSDKETARIESALALQSVALGNGPLIRHLQTRIGDSGNVRALGAMSPADWNDAVAKSGAPVPDAIGGANDDERRRNYASLLAAQFAITFPTATFAGSLRRAQKTPLKNASYIADFFDRNPDFELSSTSIDRYLGKKGNVALPEAQRKSGVVEELRAAQRAFKVAPNFDAVSTLLADGVTSAQKIHAMGKANFVRRYAKRAGFDEQSAGEAWQRAANTEAAKAAIVGELREMVGGGEIQGVSNTIVARATSDFPNLANLFGKADFCECEECRSVFGASAYFADLLQYLEARPSGVTTGVSVRDVLFTRRPDLGGIELTCENSNTPLPYIDLVCEILEDVVAPPPKVTTVNNATTVEGSLPPGPITSAAQTAFAGGTPPLHLANAATVSDTDKYGARVIRDAARTYLVVKTPADTLEVSILRQTRGPAEELRAIPEYVNWDAYTTLKNAYYPLSLPFDLATEEMRGYLVKAGVTRVDLMEVFHGNAAPNNAPSGAIDAEALGIAQAEIATIFSADAGHWGESSEAAAIAPMSHVDTFLDRTGLDYGDLLRMLTLRYINPTHAIAIQHLDSSCDTAQKQLNGLDAAALDRIARFLRLQRKLGWKMWEVDLAIHAFGGDIDSTNLLPALRALLQLKEKFPAQSVEQLVSWYGDGINTLSKFTAPFKKPEPSLYEKLFLNKRLVNPIDAVFPLDVIAGGADTIDNHHTAPILAALHLTTADLTTFRNLTSSPVDALTLANLATLYRNASLARLLRLKADDWKTLLALENRDVFATPAVTMSFVKDIERMRAAGFIPPNLAYILAADTTVKGAESESHISATLTTLRKALQAVATDNDPAKLPTDVSGLGDAIHGQLQALGWPDADAQNAVAAVSDDIQLHATAPSLASTFTFPPAVLNAMRVAWDGATHTITFTGVMTGTEKTTLLGVDPNSDYQTAINDLHAQPRTLLKFIRPRFTTPLEVLPPAVSFTDQLTKPLAAKISYDAERGELAFFGVMTDEEKTQLNALATDTTFLGAILALYNRPRIGVFTADELWLDPNTDLTLPVRRDTDAHTAADTAANLTTGATKLAKALARIEARDAVFQQLAAALSMTPAVSEELLTSFSFFGHPAIDGFTDTAFVNSSGALSAASNPHPFQLYWWLHRVALVMRVLKMTYADLQWLIANHTAAGVLGFDTLPLVSGSAAALEPYLALCDLMRFHHQYSDANASMLEIVDRVIHDGGYTSLLFAADVELLTAWPRADVAFLTSAAGIDVPYPAGYAKIASWQRLERAMNIVQRLGGSASDAAKLAGAAADAASAALLEQLLRAQYDDKSWLDVSQTINDKLRERKRDSLVAFLLTRPMPADAPSHKWDDANDLFAYYLIDVSMGACQLTSRIVQASAAVQLFVQRSFMGLEPKVRVSINDDEAWSQWSWMKYYRVWEANRRVFVYPENYAEPELRRDKSEIFKKLEDELLQNDITRDTAETAFIHYVERLDDVAQLEIAGTYYQESTDTLHVFGRTAGGDPRTYYHRRYIDGMRWTAWEKVDTDIKADYVVPLIANERMHLVWPEFHQQTEPASGSMKVPTPAQQNSGSFTPDQSQKQTTVQLAITEQRSGKWTPKKLSDPVTAFWNSDFDPEDYVILPLDLTPFGQPFLLALWRANGAGEWQKIYELAGCRGYPEEYAGNLRFHAIITRFENDAVLDMKNAETSGNTLTPQINTIMHQPILLQTPDRFHVSYPEYMSYFDRLYFLPYFPGTWNPATQRAVVDHNRRLYVTLGTFYDWFYADKLRTFHVRPELAGIDKTLFYPDYVALFQKLFTLAGKKDAVSFYALLRSFFEEQYQFLLRFRPFYHPLTCLFAKRLYAAGVEGLMERETQFANKGLDFNATYRPTPFVDPDRPKEIVDFTPDGAYSIYNWELFYHAPLMVATRLTQNQRFEDAMRWFHFIFDPTGGHDKDPVTNAPAPAPQKYWITKPFFETTSDTYKQQRIEELLSFLAGDPSIPPDPHRLQLLQGYIKEWREDPFDPHLVAQFRTVAYQKMTVMKYVDNLIAWGDQRFRMETLEALNEATQLYVVAAEILGPRPRVIPPAARPAPQTFNELEKKLDAFSNAMVDVENLIPAMPADGDPGAPSVLPNLLYFCVPPNDKLLGYWDRVADRLFKVRNCLDIEGVFRQLPLFAPPIDPALLVKAMAGGGSISSALAGLDAPLPFYRFATMLQKANEITADVRGLGAALLSALEKKDAEGLALLRQGHELAVLQAATDVKKKQIEDAQDVIDGLGKQKELITIRRDFYASRTLMNAGEIAATVLNGISLGLDAAIAVGYILSGGLKLVPQFVIGAAGFGGTPTGHVGTGGQSFGNSAEDAVKTLTSIATALDKGASLASTIAGYQRRMDDWQMQANAANKELEQIDKQIASANVKLAITQKELENHDLQIANSKAVGDFMHSKYTNQELYQWMIGEISATYRMSYNLAYDTALAAERCYRFELGLADSSIIGYRAFDSLPSGLQAGERLQLDLRRLETAYLERNRRELECTKHVSLAMLDPEALITLRESGRCFVRVPEELFDLDYPGHYFRRIKTVGISIPCVAGPQTTVNCTLRLISNSIRINSSLAGGQYERNQSDDGVLTDDDRFRENQVRVRTIATSTAQNDAGLFELNFRDERYLPFEDAGAISTWQIELTGPRELRQFDYDTISDVILHIRYTAREDAGQFRDKAIDYLKNVLQSSLQLPLRRLFDLRREFPAQWYAFTHPPAGPAPALQLPVKKQHFPYIAQNRDIKIQSVAILARTDATAAFNVQLNPPIAAAIHLGTTSSATDLHVGRSPDELDVDFDETTPWQFNQATPVNLKEAYLVVEYTLVG